MNKYYYLTANKERKGPIYPYELTSSGVNGDTYVWCTGMPDWALAKNVPELQQYLMGSASPYGQPAQPNIPETPAQPAAQQPTYNSGTTPTTPCPDNYLVWAILSTLFCCWPIGIFAIVKAAKVNGLWAQGRYAEAEKASNEAKKWSIISAVSALVFMAIYFVFILMLSLTGAMM